jgi:putative ATPase
MSLFAPLPDSRAQMRDRTRPLADRMRPASLDEFVGQEHILAPGKPLRLQIERDDPGSILSGGRRESAKPLSRKSSRA